MKSISVLIGILIIFSGCEKVQVTNSFDDLSISNIIGTWVVDSYEDLINNNLTKKADVDSWGGLDVILTFNTDSFTGRNTTNSVSGDFTLSGRNIHIIRYGGTKVGQPEWGNMFNDAVYRLESYTINEQQLKFYYNNASNRINLLKVKR